MFPFTEFNKEYFETIEIVQKPIPPIYDFPCDNCTQTEIFASDIPILIKGYILFANPSVSVIIHSLAKDKNRRVIRSTNNDPIFHTATQTTITSVHTSANTRRYINTTRKLPLTVLYCPIRFLMYKTTEDQTYLFLPAL